MCGRYFISENSEPINQIMERVDERNPLREKLRFGEIFPGDHVPVILSDGVTKIFTISFTLRDYSSRHQMAK